jgi:hypothetical protein
MKLHLIPQLKNLQPFNIFQNGLVPSILHMHWSWWTNLLGHMPPKNMPSYFFLWGCKKHCVSSTSVHDIATIPEGQLKQTEVRRRES